MKLRASLSAGTWASRNARPDLAGVASTPRPLGIKFTGTLLAMLLLACTPSAASGKNKSQGKKVNDKELRQKLTPLQYYVTQEDGTEPAFENTYWDHKGKGIYVDIVSGEALFASVHKYDSGSGWPSFTQPIKKHAVDTRPDPRAHGMATEVRSSNADSHLGHVFNDGPQPTGLRYCINSAALRFVALEEMEKEGYGEYLHLFGAANAKDKPMNDGAETAKATLAGGCFWGMEELLRAQPGVLNTTVGYTGGEVKNATYEDVKQGSSGHAESIEIVFDPSKTTYRDILRFFFRIHDPTTVNRQGNDRGSQYRSEIFAHGAEQERIAKEVIAEVNASGKWKDPVVTKVSQAGPFYTAEEYHQDYLQKHPNGYTCHFVRD